MLTKAKHLRRRQPQLSTALLLDVSHAGVLEAGGFPTSTTA